MADQFTNPQNTNPQGEKVHTLNHPPGYATTSEAAAAARDSNSGQPGKVEINPRFIQIPEGKMLVFGINEDGSAYSKIVPDEIVKSRWHNPWVRYGLMALGTLLGAGAGFAGGSKLGKRRENEALESMRVEMSRLQAEINDSKGS